MLLAMSQVELRNDGDMHTLDDVTARTFELNFARYFGKEDAIIYPTCSMSNIAAVMLHAKLGS
jgi:threonine aldolase